MKRIEVKDFIPYYPDVNTKNFYQDIYNKEEFRSLKLTKYPENVIALNNTQQKPQYLKHQKIVQRFINDHTNYNKLLLFHEMGTGKCVHPTTLVNLYINKDSFIPIKEKLKEYYQKKYFTKEEEENLFDDYCEKNDIIYTHHEIILRIPISDIFNIFSNQENNTKENNWFYPNESGEELLVESKDNFGSIYLPISKFYREHVDTHILRINLENGENITCTQNHFCLSEKGWTNNYEDVEFLISEDEEKIKIKNIEYIKYEGYVYDLEIPETHNYIANKLITHNSCSFFGITEKLKNVYKKAIIITQPTLINNLVNELVNVCSDGSYIPDNFDKLTKGEKKRRINKLVRKYYSFFTYDSIAKMIKKNKKSLNLLFNNTVVVIDEVHNIKPNADDVNIYTLIFDFLHTIKNCKIILSSGTPMTDRVSEIAYVINLLNDENNQLPTEENFDKEFLIYNKKKESYIINENKRDELKQYMRGKVSYLVSRISELKKRYVGELIGKLKYFKVVPVVMDEFQEKYYINTIDTDQKQAVYMDSRQASLSVYPDGSFGYAGFEKYIESRNNSFYLKKEFRNYFLKEKNIENRLELVKQFSAKYYYIIRDLLNSPKKKFFAFVEYVEGSGAILLTLLLELFGFGEFSLNSKTKMTRYCLITGDSKNSTDLIKKFNDSDNVFGEYCQIIIGTRVLTTGVTLLDIQKLYIITPHWNYSQIIQTIFRGIRYGSMRNLRKLGIDPELEIYRLVAIPSNKKLLNKSIDLFMYEVAEKKDVSIEDMKRLIMECAFDCQLNYDRNRFYNNDNTRECNYQLCEYTCDGINLNNKIIDYSSYNILYFNVENLVKIFVKKFELQNFVTMEELLKLEQFTIFEICKTVSYLIENRIPIYSKYNLPYYLCEKNNIFYLTNFNQGKDKMTNFYYTRFIVVGNNNQKQFQNFLQLRSKYRDNFNLLKICNSNKSEQLENVLSTFDDINKEKIILTTIKYYDRSKNKYLADFILRYFSNFISKEGNEILVSVFPKEPKITITKNGKIVGWTLATDLNNEKKIKDLSINKIDISKIVNNKYGYYGLYNKELNIFCIKEIEDEIKGQDKRKKKIGRNCITKKWEDIIDIIKKLDDIEYEISPIHSKLNKQEIINLIKKNKCCKNLNIETESKEMLLRILYFYILGRKLACSKIMEFFKKKKLIIEDNECGMSGRKK